MTLHTWDAIVIGGGAAGLSAAQALGRSLRRTLVLDAGSPRNRFATHMHNIVGFDGRTPAELGEVGRAEAERYGVEFRAGTVREVVESPMGLRVTLEAGGDVLDTRALIVATGVDDVLPEIPGLAERWGRSVLHCPYCHGWEVRGRRIAVVTTSPLGMHQSKMLRQWSDDVTVFSAGLGELDAATARMFAARGVKVVPAPVVEIVGDGAQVTEVVTAGDVRYPMDAVFAASTMVPRDGFLAGLELSRAEQPWGSFIEVSAMGQTSHPRVWAAGNVVQPAATVPVSLGAGAMAGGAVNAALIDEDYALAEAAQAAQAASQGGHTHGAGHLPPQVEPADTAEFWENHYGNAGPVWSGKVNATLAAVVAELALGRALDLGCGEGGDAIWLAQQGWQATGIDISMTATSRATTAAEAAGLDADRARFIQADLTALSAAELAEQGIDGMDLVCASFLQSPLELDRGAILRAAADLVVPGGHLVLVSHAAPPSWADIPEGMEHKFPTPAEELAGLALDDVAWQTLRAEVVRREVTAPDGSAATLDDTLVVLRRLR